MAGNSETVALGELLSGCLDAARRAGKVIREIYVNDELQIKDKGGDDPMTQADIAAQQLIIGSLLRRWPGLTIVGEETCDVPPCHIDLDCDSRDDASFPGELGEPVPIADVAVFTDPLDATKEFVNGRVWAVMTLIGITYRQKPVAGVMYQPFVDGGRLVYGIAGRGVQNLPDSHPDGQEIIQNRESGSYVMATTRMHNSPKVDALIAQTNPRKVLRAGGAAYKCLLILIGQADYYISVSATKKWDTCAPTALLVASGGVVTDLDGNPLGFTHNRGVDNQNGFLCARNQEIHNSILQKILQKKQT